MSAAPLALVLTVGYSALTGGLRSGLVSGAIAAAFCGYCYREAVPHAFDRFWRARRTERRGLGPGLVRGIVQAHGGRVWAENELGTGSTFRFTMPLAATDGAGASMDGVGRPAP